MSGSDSASERRHDYTALTALVRETLDSLRARDGDVALNAERLKTVVDTTREIKEQLTRMNGRVRQNEKDLVAINANPPLTREHCDEQREGLEERMRTLEGKTPAVVQSIAISFTTGGALAVFYYLLSQLP